MKRSSIIIIIGLSFLVGVLFFLIRRKIIIIQYNLSPISQTLASQSNNSDHKSVHLYFWKNNDWHHEKSTLVWHENNDAHNLKVLISHWLTTLKDEHLVPLHITIESVVIGTPGGELYLSFDRSLFDQTSSTKQKWLIIEGLFKTLRAAHNGVQSVTFLVHHTTMQDDHIELSQAIPVQEFCSW